MIKRETETKAKSRGGLIGLIILLVVFGFMAIGSSGSIAIGSSESSSDNMETTSSVQVDDEVKAEDQTSDKKKDQKKDAKDTAENQKKAGSSSSDIKSPSSVQSGGDKNAVESIEERVILDKNGIKITAKGLDKDGFLGTKVKLLIENESGKDITVQARNVSVNGYMASASMSAAVVNGKKANDDLFIMSSSLEKAGISTIADIEFSFHVFETHSFDSLFDSDIIQLKTSAADSYEYTFDDSGDVVYDEGGVKIVVKGLSESDSIFGPGIIVYTENNSEKNVTVQVRDVSVNGFMTDPIFSADVAAGKHAIDSITFMSYKLDENGINSVKDVELSFHIFNELFGESIDTDTVKISF